MFYFRGEVLYFVVEGSGLQRIFPGAIFVIPRARLGRSSCIRRLFYIFLRDGLIYCQKKMIIAMLQENALTAKRKRGEYVDTEDDTDDDIEVIEPAQGWAYVGSHNFTPSAWGTLSGSSFSPILNVSY